VAQPPISGATLRGAVDLSSLVAPPRSTAPAAAGGVVVSATDATATNVLELSRTVPVIIEFYGAGIEPALGDLVTQFGGRLVLATVDAAANPQLAQAFQVAEVPAVAAIVGGKPLQLFVGMPPLDDVRRVLDQVLTLAAQEGVTGTVPTDGAAATTEPTEPVEEPLPPLHQEAFDAISAGDFPLAIVKYQTAIAQNPRDELAIAGLAQVSLLARIDGAEPEAVRAAAAAAPKSVAAQLAVADLDVAGGHLEDAFARLLDIFVTLDAEGKNTVRTRLLEYFEVAGADDPRVAAARRTLTGLLY
jgi:putative thioredoxin